MLCSTWHLLFPSIAFFGLVGFGCCCMFSRVIYVAFCHPYPVPSFSSCLNPLRERKCTRFHWRSDYSLVCMRIPDCFSLCLFLNGLDATVFLRNFSGGLENAQALQREERSTKRIIPCLLLYFPLSSILSLVIDWNRHHCYVLCSNEGHFCACSCVCLPLSCSFLSFPNPLLLICCFSARFV